MWFEFDAEAFTTAMSEMFARHPRHVWLHAPADGSKFFLWSPVEAQDTDVNQYAKTVYNTDSMVRCPAVRYCECNGVKPILYRRGDSYFIVFHFTDIKHTITITVQPCYAPKLSNTFYGIERYTHITGLALLLANGTIGKLSQVHGDDGGLYVSTKRDFIKFDEHFRGAVRVGKYAFHTICDARYLKNG